jgi:hypothetical protein
MSKVRVEPVEAFEQLDELVEVFLRTARHPNAHAHLVKLMHEAELVVACLDRLDEWIQIMEKPETRISIPEPWSRECEDQIRLLYSGCDDLVEVAMQIIPGKVRMLVKPFLN